MEDGEYVRYRPSNFRKTKAYMRNMDGTFSTYDPTKLHERAYASMGGHPTTHYCTPTNTSSNK